MFIHKSKDKSYEALLERVNASKEKAMPYILNSSNSYK